MQKIKIVHLINTLGRGGAEMMLYKLLSRMNQQRFQNVVIRLIDQGEIKEKIEALGIPVYSLGMQRGQPSLIALWKLVQLLRREQPDILQTWLYHSDLMGLLTAKWVKGTKLVWNIRCSNMDLSKYRYTTSLVVKMSVWLSRFPDVVLVNSKAGQEIHTQIGYRPKRWKLIPNGIDTEKFKPDLNNRRSVRQELALDSHKAVIGLVARFDPMKGHDTFLQAAGLALKKAPNLHFILVGRDVVPQNPILQDLIAQQNLSGKVGLLGERNDINRIISSLSILSSSSYGEGFSNVIAEAMACEIPTVVTDVGDSAWIVGDTGRVVKPGNPEALATAWLELLEMDISKRRELGKKARQRITEYFDINSIVQKYEAFYETV